MLSSLTTISATQPSAAAMAFKRTRGVFPINSVILLAIRIFNVKVSSLFSSVQFLFNNDFWSLIQKLSLS